MKFISLRTKLIVAFITFILIPILAASIIGYKEVENVLRNQIESTTSDRLHQVNMNIERKLKAMMYASNSIVLEDHIRELLKRPYTTEREQLDISKLINDKYLEISTTLISDNVYLTLIDNYGNMYTNWGSSESSYERILRSEWYKQTVDQNGFMVWSLNQENYIHPQKEGFITVSRVIKSQSLTENLGVLIISEPVENYINILKVRTNIPDSYGFMVDEQGSMIGDESKNINQIYQYIKPTLTRGIDTFNWEVDGKKAIVSTYHIPLTGWRVLQIVSHDGIFTDVSKIQNIVFIILLVSMAIFIGIIILFSTMLTRPLIKLRETMKRVEEGDLDVTFTSKNNDEIGLLGKSFNTMISQTRDNVKQRVLLERNREKAKLEALQAQINPHFLYNTLNTIRWMSVMAGTKNITKMLMSLGQLLDMSIHRGQEEITLKEELENVEAFLTIQKYRFGDSIKVIEEINPDTVDCIVPKLSLQPLVENVYNHGLFLHGGTMEIRTQSTNDILEIHVIDNGKNMDQEKASQLMNDIQKEKHEGLSGIGLKNVHQRIQMMFGEQYGIKIWRDNIEEKTYVTLSLPVKRF
ncbi:MULTISPECIES: sensor histidine kinase [unclassified Fredinandcohnia]|uniref:sensor histidine kinase n=1 Tax=unclassified Fredinandcohnia TaxID=2837514 RepID=UPI0030FDF14E